MTNLETRLAKDFNPEIRSVITLSIIHTSKSILELINIENILNQQGFNVLYAEPYMDFRTDYEEKYRQVIEQDNDKGKSLVIITTESFEQIDFDILKIAEEQQRIFDYQFSQLFPQVVSALENVSASIPKNIDEWIGFAKDFGFQLNKINASSEGREYKDVILHFLDKINRHFTLWCNQKYSNLLSDSYIDGPKTLNNILHHIAYRLRKKELQKVAIIVFDGMSFDQWELIKQALPALKKLIVEEYGTFSMIPTLTSVSRQAIFSGKLPREYKKYINSTYKEKDLWESFWNEENRSDAVYIKPMENFKEQLHTMENVIEDNQIKIIGTVFPIIDELMHKSSQGYPELYSSIKLWLKNGYLKKVLDDLIREKYEIYITSDHGNIDAIPGGQLNEGVIADTKGQRVRVYDREITRDNALNKYAGLVKLDNKIYALPDDYLPLVHEKANYFGTGNSIITHGGLSVQEVIVPFIHIKEHT